MPISQFPPGRAMRLVSLLTAAVLTSGAIAACGQAGPTESGRRSGDASGQGNAFPRTIEHAMGQTTIKERPQRIVTLDRTFTDAALALDATVVGRTTFTPADPKLPAYLQKAGGQHTEGTKVVGLLTEPDLEEIVQLDPDLILSAKVRHEAIYDKLSKIAPTVFSETTGTWKSNLELVGRALGKEELAKSKIAAFEQRAAKIGDEIRAKLDENPTVTLVRFAGEPTVRLYTRNSYPGGVIYGDVGLVRPERAPTSQKIAVNLSEERILDLEADHILVATYKGGQTDKPENIRKQFQNTPLWQQLSGEIHTIDDTILFTSVGLLGAREMLDALAKVFGVDPAKSASDA